MRHLGVLPFVGLVQPTDKIPIGSYIQDLEEMHKKTIDPVTGRMFIKHSLQDDLRDKRIREKAMIDRKSQYMAGPDAISSEQDAIDEGVRQITVRELNLDQTYAEYPNPIRRDWNIAQGHLVKT